MATLDQELRARKLLPPLYEVSGSLVENYNRALRKVTGLETQLKSFQIDARGLSPQLREELGPGYLHVGSAARYMIVVSPEQQNAGHLDQAYSFDEDAIASLYENHLSGISIVTRVDGLYGHLDTGVRSCECVSDLLGMRSLGITLHTPSGFITAARDLRRSVEALEADPKLLVANNSEHVRKLYDLAQQTGDVRSYAITSIGVTKELSSFASSDFGGVYVFRKTKRSLGIKRPDASAEQLADESSGATTVISNEDVASNENVHHIRLGTSAVHEFLISRKLAQYEPLLIEPRLERIEDALLLKQGYDVVDMSWEQKQVELSRQRMPASHKALREVQRGLANGQQFDRLTRGLEPAYQSMLLAPRKSKAEPAVKRLLAALNPLDYESLFSCDTAALEKAACDDRARKYIITALQEYTDKR